MINIFLSLGLGIILIVISIASILIMIAGTIKTCEFICNGKSIMISLPIAIMSLLILCLSLQVIPVWGLVILVIFIITVVASNLIKINGDDTTRLILQYLMLIGIVLIILLAIRLAI